MSIKYAILGLLGRKDLHGYRIKQVIERDFGHMWTVNFGQIYPTLRKMRDEGLVTMIEVPRPKAPARKLYSITEKGRREFGRWLNAQPDKNAILRDPFLLRFPFFDLGDPQGAIDAIQEQIEQYQNQIEERREFLAHRARANDYARLLSELGVELNETMLRWLQRARAELAEPRDDAGTVVPMRQKAAGGAEDD